MKQWYFIIDVAKCWDCNNCFIACKDEHEGNDWPGYTLAQPRHDHRWINVHRRERGQYPLIDVAYRPTPCMHCKDAPCVEASDGAITRREDGIVLIDPEKSAGKKDLIASCPYGVIFWNDEKNVPQKCTMCAHLLDDGWAQPRCAQACFTGALRAVSLEDDEIQQLVEAEGLEQLHPEKGTRPNVYYNNLYRFNKEFITGSAAVQLNDVVDCAQGVVVKLHKGGELLQECITDVFGDFRFEGLPQNSGEYMVELQPESRSAQTIEVDLTKSLNLGTIIV
ncbi:MAG: 4Fe-4S dicluster domain-containing protein [Desulfocapsaceae bacterium]